MARRLPPLNSLRAFEAAARHLSFSRAAEELHVTPAAVSHQIRALEEHLGVKLFRRLNRAVLLTDAGQACVAGLSDAFDRMAAALARLRAQEGSGPLTVSTSPALASKWLVPRLERFQQLYPELDVRISAAMRLVDFAREDVDLAIRYGTGTYPGLLSELLLTNEVVPVCAPALLEGPRPLRTPADIRQHTLLHDDTRTSDGAYPNWAMWLRAAGLDDIDPGRGLRFDYPGLVLEAAAAGRGVALALSTVAAADLAAGRLVKPFAVTVPTPFAYYLVCPEATAERPKVGALRRWLHAEARSATAPPDEAG
ncbi:MAG TPA: transcriptional regulator GcvA [Geminicoccaceae bacterium]|nr:transcriptional regulator GcvA [Geminicoccaceae bacterium]